MATMAAGHDQSTAGTEHPKVAIWAVAVVIAGALAAWLAAGSIGFFAHPLRIALCWVALTVALAAGWPRRSQSPGAWLIVAVAVLLALALTATADPVVATLAVALVLSAIAFCHEGIDARAILLAALAAAVLGIFRLACTSIPTVWLAGDAVGRAMGGLAGTVAGEPLSVGATFAGLDVLVLMAVLYVGWLTLNSRPRLVRAVVVAAVILAVQFAYLILLANCDKLAAMLPLPDPAAHPNNDTSRVGTWTWTETLRTALPWNLPLVAGAAQAVVVGIMFRRTKWSPPAQPDQRQPNRVDGKRPQQGTARSGEDPWCAWYAVLLLAGAAAVLTTLQPSTSTLKDKNIVACGPGLIDPARAESGRASASPSRVCAMLPVFVEGLGGKFEESDDLPQQTLDKADAVLLLEPRQPWPADRLDRLWAYVRNGGSLLVATGPGILPGEAPSTANEVLAPTAIEVGVETTVPAVERWEHCCEPLAHPITAGLDDWRNRFGLSLGTSIRTYWPARPVVAGRFAYLAEPLAWGDPGKSDGTPRGADYVPGERLGDVVLAAEQPFGKGRIVVLGDTSPLTDYGNMAAYEFTGRLLGYLAGRGGSPQAWWRQMLGLLAMAALVAALAWRAKAWLVGITSAALAVTLVCCTSASHQPGEVPPRGGVRGGNALAYIDASHLEAYSDRTWDSLGLGTLVNTLTRYGYLPLFSPELTPERLQHARLLVSIGPARPFSQAEREAVRRFVERGGRLICTVGAEEAITGESLLSEFGFSVPHSPVGPADHKGREPAPERRTKPYLYNLVAGDNSTGVSFYAAWPVECNARDAEWLTLIKREPEGDREESPIIKREQELNGDKDFPFIVRRRIGEGTVVVIGDTYFATNWNLRLTTADLTQNWRLWQWLLGHEGAGPPVEPIENDRPIEPDSDGGDP